MGKLSASECRILFAEDDEDFYVITRFALEQAGFTGKLDLIQNCRALMRYLEKRESPSLIILDLKTRPDDWRAALQELKKDTRYEDIPVVVLTATSEPRDIALCERYRGCSYIQKPSTFEDWRVCMEDMIRNHLPN
jgi:CheY-like chemotaxis protein